MTGTRDSTARDLEILVAKIQASLAPDAEVIHDARLPGRHSGRSRQIDVLLRQRIGQHEINIVLECKDHRRPLDVKGVEAFQGLLDDVGAQCGALVSPSGFTAAAKTRAAGSQIKVYSPVDTDPHKWQADVAVPFACDLKRALMWLRISFSAPKPFKMPSNLMEACCAYDEGDRSLGIPIEVAANKWTNGGFPTEPGEHHNLPIYDTAEVLMDNGYDERVPVRLTATVAVERQLFFGYLPIAKVSGFKDELSGAILTNAFTTGLLDVEDVLQSWMQVRSEEQFPVRPMMTVVGLVGGRLSHG